MSDIYNLSRNNNLSRNSCLIAQQPQQPEMLVCELRIYLTDQDGIADLKTKLRAINRIVFDYDGEEHEYTPDEVIAALDLVKRRAADDENERLRAANAQLRKDYEELVIKHECLIDAVTNGRASKASTPNDVVVSLAEEFYDNGRFEAENECDELTLKLEDANLNMRLWRESAEKAQADNAKLRGVAAELYPFVGNTCPDSCRWCDKCDPMGLICVAYNEYFTILRDLGIEVER